MDYLNSDYYLNRELTWLKFNQRVLLESIDKSNPLLERLKFIAITGSNLNEFFMIRVAGIKHLIESGIMKRDIANMTPQEQMAAITTMAHRQVVLQYAYLKQLLGELREEGLAFIRPDELTQDEREWLDTLFEREIYPVVTPMAVDASHPFPFLASRSLNIAVLLTRKGSAEIKTAILPVPSVLDRIIELPRTGTEKRFILLEDVLHLYAGYFFFGHDIVETAVFSITRDGDLDIDEEDTNDLLKEVEKSLQQRRKGAAVRAEIQKGASRRVRRFILDTLMLEDSDVYEIDGPIDCNMFFKFSGMEGYDHLRYPAAFPQKPAEFLHSRSTDIWTAVAERDVMVHHPFESFSCVEYFVEAAAKDPNVLAIKQTLYRVSSDSPIIRSLAEAAANGKQVTVLMEVKARFDEENNIIMARRLEKAGCHVIYGLVGLKTHSKITMVVRREEDGIRRYVHLATGNYNGSTARFYTDVGIFTANALYGMDASAFFNLLSGYSDPPVWNKLIVAPLNLREKIVENIENEIAWAKKGEPAHIIAKMNSLLDKKVIAKLYEASCAGVKIELIVRGICVLRPGLAGVSENITVRSIVGRYLEHSRLFYFRDGGNEKVYLSSADWMPRNLNERVELMVPIEEEAHKKRVKAILDIYLKDNMKAHLMKSDGNYRKIINKTDEPILAQEYLQKMAEMQAAPKPVSIIERMKPSFSHESE